MAPHPDLRVARTTPPTPATPFVTARANWRAPVRDALEGAIAAMPARDRTATRLRGIVDLPGEPYATGSADAG
jgi:ABC-type phosphate/phosphonate transport system substrate-binding protein